MEGTKFKRKDNILDLQIVWESEDKPTVPHYANTAWKFEKELDLTWRILYQVFSHEEYSKIPFDEGME